MQMGPFCAPHQVDTKILFSAPNDGSGRVIRELNDH